MADHLRESSNQAAALTQASLPYIQQGADFMGGVQRGQQIAGEAQRQQFAARQMMLQESQHEAEMQDLSLKAQLYQGELALRREQAATQMAEAQAQVARAQSQIQLDQIQGRRQGAETRQALSTLPPRKNRDGSYSIADIGDGGQTTWTKVDESDPYVQRYLAETGASQAREQDYLASAEFNRRRRSGTTNVIGGNTVRAMLADEQERLRKMETSMLHPGTPAEIEEQKKKVAFLQDTIFGMIEDAKAPDGESPAPTRDTVKPPPSEGSAVRRPDGAAMDQSERGVRMVQGAFDKYPALLWASSAAVQGGAFPDMPSMQKALGAMVDEFQKTTPLSAETIMAEWLRAVNGADPDERDAAIMTAKRAMERAGR